MSTQHPIYGNRNRRTPILPYAIYSCVPKSAFTSALKAIEDNVDLVPPLQIFQNHHISDVITYHQSLCQTTTSTIHPLYILIIDKEDFQQCGVLIANLDVHIDHTWKVEYMRQLLISEPVSILASINMAVTDWEETLENTEFGIQWDRYFAKYPTTHSFRSEKEPWAEKWDKMPVQAFWEFEGPERQSFCASQVWKENLEEHGRVPVWGGDIVGEVARIHAGVARENEKYHEELCLWFDVEAFEKRKEIMVVKLREENEAPDTRTLPVPEAANFLVDIAMGLRNGRPDMEKHKMNSIALNTLTT